MHHGDVDPELANRTHPFEEDMPLQLRVWRFERAGWLLLGLLLLAMLLGLFANGPLSQTSLRTQDGELGIDYQRFARSSLSTRLIITATANADGRLSVELAGDLDRYSLADLQPPPETVELGDGSLTLQFSAAPGRRASLPLELRPLRAGLAALQLGVNGKTLRVHQFIHP